MPRPNVTDRNVTDLNATGSDATARFRLRHLRRIVDWLLPPLCLGCNRTPAGGRIDSLNLCPSCRARCRPVGGPRCPTCLAALAPAWAPASLVCGACRRRPPAFSRVLAGWRYQPPLREVVLALKFRDLEYLADSLAAELVARHQDRLDDCEAVVAVPLHWRRALERGYNQAGLLAAGIARGLGLAHVRALARTRHTSSQTGLDRRRRRANLRHVFRLTRHARPIARHWLLIDDVFTTGATLDAAARCLLRGGAHEVTALVVAYTPKPLRPR